MPRPAPPEPGRFLRRRRRDRHQRGATSGGAGAGEGGRGARAAEPAASGGARRLLRRRRCARPLAKLLELDDGSPCQRDRSAACRRRKPSGIFTPASISAGIRTCAAPSLASLRTQSDAVDASTRGRRRSAPRRALPRSRRRSCGRRDLVVPPHRPAALLEAGASRRTLAIGPGIADEDVAHRSRVAFPVPAHARQAAARVAGPVAASRVSACAGAAGSDPVTVSPTASPSDRSGLGWSTGATGSWRHSSSSSSRRLASRLTIGRPAAGGLGGGGGSVHRRVSWVRHSGRSRQVCLPFRRRDVGRPRVVPPAALAGVAIAATVTAPLSRLASPVAPSPSSLRWWCWRCCSSHGGWRHW